MPSFRLNNLRVSWNSVSFKYDACPFGEGVQSLDVEETREVKKVYGSRRDGKPTGMTSGKYNVEPITLKMTREATQPFLLYLATKGLGSPGDAEFMLSLSIYEPVLGNIPMFVVVEGCRIVGKKLAHSESTDELVTEFKIEAMEMSENLLSLASFTRGLLP